MSRYILNVAIKGASSAFYCNVSLDSGVLFDGFGSCIPSQLAKISMAFQGPIAFQVPAGDASCGAFLSATTPTISGAVIVNPPINVPTVVALVGATGLARYILPAGQGLGQFVFNVGTSDGIPEDQVAEAVQKLMII